MEDGDFDGDVVGNNDDCIDVIEEGSVGGNDDGLSNGTIEGSTGRKSLDPSDCRNEGILEGRSLGSTEGSKLLLVVAITL